MDWRFSSRARPASGFIEPCIPTKAVRAPVGPDWVYEIKHDGYRLMVRKDGEAVRVFTRRGVDWTKRFPRIVEAVRRLKATSVLIDGEGIVYDGAGMPNFDPLRSHNHGKEVSLVAFDLLEHNGDDLRKKPLLDRKKRLLKLTGKVKYGIEYNDHIADDDKMVFEVICELDHEGSWPSRLICRTRADDRGDG